MILLLSQDLIHLRPVDLPVGVEEVVVDAGIVVGVEVFVAFRLAVLVHLPVVDVAPVASEDLVPGRGILTGHEDDVVAWDGIDVLQSVGDLLVELLEVRDDRLPLGLHVGANGLALPIVRQVGSARPIGYQLVLAVRVMHLVLLAAARSLLLLLA